MERKSLRSMVVLAAGLLSLTLAAPANAQSRAAAIAAQEKAVAAPKVALKVAPVAPPVSDWQKFGLVTKPSPFDLKPFGKPYELPEPSAVLKPSPWRAEKPAFDYFAVGKDDAMKKLWPAIAQAFDTTRFPGERQIVAGWRKDFPILVEFEVKAAGTENPSLTKTKAGTFNCISHTAGIKNYWINPFQTRVEWDKFYAPLGYKPTSNLDTSFVAGQQKVAVYAVKKNSGLEYTHGSVQEADGTWTSKLGSGPLIRHKTADAVNGPIYGEVVRVYVRSR